MVTGLDTNILCYALDPAFPEYSKVRGFIRNLSPESSIAINPTVVHESYHTFVYEQKWTREEAKTRLSMLMQHPYVEFYNQTRSVSTLALNLAGKYQLGGRDALIIANFLANHVPLVYTHDSELLNLARIEWRGLRMKLLDPITK